MWRGCFIFKACFVAYLVFSGRFFCFVFIFLRKIKEEMLFKKENMFFMKLSSGKNIKKARKKIAYELNMQSTFWSSSYGCGSCHLNKKCLFYMF